MAEPEKPFACTMPDCGMTFTNEDHLHVHTKKHDMVLQFGMEQKAAFVADQTPTPTRFIRNCEEVGLFQDLQTVNPFDEGFKRAMESKQGILSLETTPPSTEDLHTPQMVFSLDPGDCVYTANNQKNITISRSSSDESGRKEFETTTISKLTNEVTTISRIVEKHDDINKTDEKINNSVSYTNNVIKIQSNVEITQNFEKTDDKIVDKPPILSQQSIDNVVESLTSEFEKPKKEEYEVIIKLPTGQQIKLKSDDNEKKPKEILKKVLTEKVESKNVPQIPVLNVSGGTLIPVTVLNTNIIPKIPLKFDKKPVKRKVIKNNFSKNESSLNKDINERQNLLESRCAASRRYRQKLKETWSKRDEELRQMREKNDILKSEVAMLKNIIIQHMKTCPNSDDLRNLQHKMNNTGT